MTVSVEPLEQSGRLTDVRATRCENLPRSLGAACPAGSARQIADYAAGYAEALADSAGDDVDDWARPSRD